MTTAGKLANAAQESGLADFVGKLVGWDVGARGGVVDGWKGALPLLEVVAFDADADAARGKGDVTWCPVGLAESSGSYDLYLLRRRSGSSLIEPNHSVLSQFNTDDYCALDDVVSIDCLSPADAIAQKSLTAPHVIKLDTQGTEISILAGFTEQQLAGVLAVEIEVEFVEFYKGQPLFAEVHSYMLDQGFTLFDIRTHRAFRANEDHTDGYLRQLGRTRGSNRMNAQLVAGDAVYFRMPVVGEAIEADHVGRLVLLLCMYQAFESAMWVAENFAKTDEVKESLQATIRGAVGRATIRERIGGLRVVRALTARLHLPFFDQRVFYTRRAWPNQ